MNSKRLLATVILTIVPAAIIFILIFSEVLSSGCLSCDQETTELKVVYAGSLIVPFRDMEAAFESNHPGVDVLLEGHGSIQAVRQVTDLKRGFDVVVVADDSLIPAMMYPDHSNWSVRFAQNEMVIAYTENSRYADEINKTNWYEILTRPDVKFGFSNPMFDACGYRTLMLIALAESYYDDETIFDELIGPHFDPPIFEIEEGDVKRVVVPETFHPVDDTISIRGGSVQLIAMLDYADLDYVFEYESVAQQNGLRYLKLPPQIGLGSPEYANVYRDVEVALGFQRFESIGFERSGKPIFYGITIPKNAPHPELGAEFVRFVLSDVGQKILANSSTPPIISEADCPDCIPRTIRALMPA